MMPKGTWKAKGKKSTPTSKLIQMDSCTLHFQNLSDQTSL